MAQDKKPFEVGHDISDILVDWRPQEGSTEDIADAVMDALEQYNLAVAETMESELRTIFVYLDQKMKERLRSM